MVGLDGVEPSTSRLSGVRSNQAELQALKILYFVLDSTCNFNDKMQDEPIIHFSENLTWSLKTK